ncbi:MAG: hypothetical protein ACREHG_05165, partial [Candidatus Saccharimonadales bacterium]
MASYVDLFNETSFTGDNLTTNFLTVQSSLLLPGLAGNSLLGLDSSSTAVAYTLTNGQLLIGRTGSAPYASTLSGTVNQVIVTNGIGSITLSAPQDIATTSSPTFAGLTLSGLTASSLMATDEKNAAQSLGLTTITHMLLGISGTNLEIDTPQDISPTASPAFASLPISPNTSTPLIQLSGLLGAGNLQYDDDTLGMEINDNHGTYV